MIKPSLRNKNYLSRLSLTLFLSIGLLINGAFAQSFHFGLPVEEFFPYDFENIVSLTHDDDNKLYISTGDEIICFNSYFDKILEDNNKISSLNFFDSTLFVGGNQFFGKLNSELTINFKKAEAEVSHIAKSNYGTFILSKNTVFHFKDNVAKKYSFPGIVDYLGSVNESTILHDDTNGLSIFVGGRFKIVNNSDFLADMQVVDIKSFGPGEYMVATKYNGLYRFDGELFFPFSFDFLEGKEIVDLEIINSEFTPGEVIIITNKKELISFNFSGQLVKDKLFTDNLLALHKDNKNRLFVLSKKGVHVLFYNLPFQIIDKSVDPIHGPLSIFDNKLYWGTNNGLFYSRIMESNTLVDARIRVKDTEGKVGKLDIVNNTLLMSHEDGLYDVLPKIGARFIPDEKFFDFVELTDNYLIAFSDRNNYLLKKLKNKWSVEKELNELPIHPKTAVFDSSNYLWLVDRDYNLIQYTFDVSQELLEEVYNKGHANKIEIFELDNEIILFRENNIYRYNYENNLFEISDELSAIFGKNLNIEAIKNDQYNNVWYIQDGQVGVFRSIKINNKISYKKLMLDYPYSDARSIYPYDKNNVFINNGSYFVKIDLEKYQKQNTPNPELIKASIKSTTSKYIFFEKSPDNSLLNKTIELKPTESLSLYFEKPVKPDSKLEYAIVGEDDKQVSWRNSKNSAEITWKNSQPGDYEILVKNVDYNGVSETRRIPIVVKRGFLSSNLRFSLLLAISALLIIISFLVGYTLGKKRSFPA